MDVTIRNATLTDIPSILDIAKQSARFISDDEVRTFLQVDPEAMFVADVDGKLIGSCCATGLTPELGHMGLYVVLPEYRGKGIGLKLWKAAKEHLGDRNIGVRGYPPIFKKYSENEGFCNVEDYSVNYYERISNSLPTNINVSSDIKVATYFEGNFVGLSKKFSSNCSYTNEKELDMRSAKIENGEGSFDSNTINTTENASNNIKTYEILPHTGKDLSIQSEYEGLVESENEAKVRLDPRKFRFDLKILNDKQTSKAKDILSEVVSFDKLLHKRDRSLIVRQTFFWKSCRTKVALQGGKVVGYACLRKVVTEDWLISPFYADTEGVAEILMFQLLHEFDFSQAPKGIKIRFPDKNVSCNGIAEKFGFRKYPICLLTGYTKHCVNIDTSKIYSFHSTGFCSE